MSMGGKQFWSHPEDAGGALYFYRNIELVLVFLLYLKPGKIFPFNQNVYSWLWQCVGVHKKMSYS